MKIAQLAKNIPRYTSFPPRPYWQNNSSIARVLEEMRYVSEKQDVDLYIHIPYCEKLCWYCGCHRSVTRNQEKISRYVHALKKEWSFYLESLNISLSSVHFGGGTPTILNAQHFESLLSVLKPYFAADITLSVEIDPRSFKDKHLQVFKKYRFERFSLGVQDFDTQVQESINRLQSLELVSSVTNQLRSLSPQSINFDLIYGLPHQSLKTAKETFDSVKKLSPDSIALFSYAHLPDKLKNQKLILDESLPNMKTKAAIFDFYTQALLSLGYIQVGMDHFCKPDHFLSHALKTRNLKRNFMGYTDRCQKVLIPLGASSIGNTTKSFFQNHCEVNKYIESLEKGTFPWSIAYRSSDRDLKTREIIDYIMCYFTFSKNQVEPMMNKSLKNDLLQFQEWKLLREEEDHYVLTTFGRQHVRLVASLFDHHLLADEERRFSSSI